MGRRPPGPAATPRSPARSRSAGTSACRRWLPARTRQARPAPRSATTATCGVAPLPWPARARSSRRPGPALIGRSSSRGASGSTGPASSPSTSWRTSARLRCPCSGRCTRSSPWSRVPASRWRGSSRCAWHRRRAFRSPRSPAVPTGPRRRGRTAARSRLDVVGEPTAGTALKAFGGWELYGSWDAAGGEGLPGVAAVAQPDGSRLELTWYAPIAPNLGIWLDDGGWPPRPGGAASPARAAADDLARRRPGLRDGGRPGPRPGARGTGRLVGHAPGPRPRGAARRVGRPHEPRCRRGRQPAVCRGPASAREAPQEQVAPGDERPQLGDRGPAGCLAEPAVRHE